jgi:hypothetical protein
VPGLDAGAHTREQGDDKDAAAAAGGEVCTGSAAERTFNVLVVAAGLSAGARTGVAIGTTGTATGKALGPRAK